MYPLKGVHQVLKAVAILITEFPNIQVKVAGPNITSKNSILEILKLGGYGSYIQSLINKYKLHKHVQFLGTLNEEQMVNEYRNAHVFICPSSIENSPNSLGEAQLIGVPSIAAYVGGIPDMIINGRTGLLYRFEEVEMLTENIRNIFKNDNLANKLSSDGIVVAEERHNWLINLNTLLAIYQLIIVN